MSIAVKSASQSSTKYVNRASVAGPDYEQGVRNPKRSWEQATFAAEKNYEVGITESMGRKAFGKGVKKAGDGKWIKGVVEKGVSRYPVGVSVAKSAYETAIAPFLDTISKITLPPKGPKGSPANIQRVAVIAKALNDKKKSLLG